VAWEVVFTDWSFSTLSRLGCALAPGIWPIAWLAMALRSAGWPDTAFRKSALVVLTVASPTTLFSETTVPPAALMAAWAASAEAPFAYRTTYSAGELDELVAAGDELGACCAGPACAGTLSAPAINATVAPSRSLRMGTLPVLPPGPFRARPHAAGA
jgi:hypothetical protein